MRRLTKRLAVDGLVCPKRMWCSAHRPDLASPLTASVLRRIELGQEVGAIAREALGPGLMIEGFDEDDRALATLMAIEDGAACIFEATFVTSSRSVRVDILRRTGDGWELVEVKSSKAAKLEHFVDLAYQTMVVEEAGLRVSKISLALLDGAYRLEAGGLDPKRLFGVTDVTAKVRDKAAELAVAVQPLEAVLSSTEMPEASLEPYCFRDACSFLPSCRVGRETDIFTLPNLHQSTLARIRATGATSISEIPEAVRLTESQRRMREVIRFHETHVEPNLGDALARIRFPAHFVDFESASPAVPMIVGTAPYDRLVFQWSDHRLDAPDAEPVHAGFLHTGTDDPRPEVAESLHEHLESAKSVVFYSSFEVASMAMFRERGIPLGSELASIFESRGVDLLTIVRECVYAEGFQGSFSIKKVLPALVPGLSYEGLMIADGEAASLAYLRMRNLSPDSAERAEILAALAAYCALDTLAMVKLYQRLLVLA